MKLSFQRKGGLPFSSQTWRGLFSVATTALITLTGASQAKAQSPVVVQAVAGLRTINTSSFANDTVAYVIDYYPLAASAHRGGGHFRWITPRSNLGLCCGQTIADDGGRFITNSVSTNGVWERVFDGSIPNVKMWGAYGDGSHDDTAAIQNAMNGVRDWTGAGEILFPAGTYMVSNTLVFNPTLTHVMGEGPLNTFVTMKLGVAKDIFWSWNAYLFLTGVADPNQDFDHGLIFENMGLTFQDDGNIQSGHPSRNKTNAGLVLGIPGEVSSIRNVHINNGGIGIRCLGGGAPGISVRDVKCNESAIAGILIQPYPGATQDGGGPVSIIGLSGDQNYGDAAATASLVVISNDVSLVSISSVKAESDWGGGLFHYYVGDGNGSLDNLAHLSLHEVNYNAGQTIDGQFYQPDFLKIDKSANYTTGSLGPVVTIEQVRLNAIVNLINDTIGGRIVEADTQGWWGLDQLAANLPITYQPAIAGGGIPTYESPGSTLMIGETAFTTFYPTNTGWYRIMVPWGGAEELSGRVTISSPYSKENIEMQVDCTDGVAPWLNVTRCKNGMHVISQARAINYWDSTLGGEWNFVDVFVTNALPVTASGKANRLTIALDTAGMSPLNHVQAQLLAPVIKVSDTPPSGANVTTVNTYR